MKPVTISCTLETTSLVTEDHILALVIGIILASIVSLILWQRMLVKWEEKLMEISRKQYARGFDDCARRSKLVPHAE